MLSLETADLESIAEELERRAARELGKWAGCSDDLLAADRHYQAHKALQSAAQSCRFAYTLPQRPGPAPERSC